MGWNYICELRPLSNLLFILQVISNISMKNNGVIVSKSELWLHKVTELSAQ
jgi:hypothetical protein